MAMWTVHLEGGPRRVNHAAVVIGKMIYSFGGYCTGEDFEVTRPMDIHVLNTVTFRWTALPTPERDSEQIVCVPYQRYGHTAVAYDDCAFIWGGRNDCDGASNILHCFNTANLQWTKPKVKGDIPGARDGHSACIVNSSMYIFGGYEESVDMFSNEVYALNLDTLEWSWLHVVGKPPRWRDFHTACGIDDNMYIFGGRMDHSGPYHTANEFYCNKLLVFNTRSKRWHEPDTTGDIPYGRRSHSVWQYNGYMYIFGGYNGLHDLHFNDVFCFNPDTNKWSLVEVKGDGPTRRRRQCCCLLDKQLFLFGGTSPCRDPDQSVEFNLMDHSDLHVLDYDPSLKTLCSLVVIKHHLPTEDLPPDIRWELTAMTTNCNISRPLNSSG